MIFQRAKKYLGDTDRDTLMHIAGQLDAYYFIWDSDLGEAVLNPVGPDYDETVPQAISVYYQDPKTNEPLRFTVYSDHVVEVFSLYESGTGRDEGIGKTNLFDLLTWARAQAPSILQVLVRENLI